MGRGGVIPARIHRTSRPTRTSPFRKGRPIPVPSRAAASAGAAARRTLHARSHGARPPCPSGTPRRRSFGSGTGREPGRARKGGRAGAGRHASLSFSHHISLSRARAHTGGPRARLRIKEYEEGCGEAGRSIRDPMVFEQCCAQTAAAEYSDRSALALARSLSLFLSLVSVLIKAGWVFRRI